MSTEKNQSDIAEVRDQLSLDFADDTYLNVVGQNLGLSRPVFGFGDDTWRALVKTLALDYKQIATKFHDVLEILFGPQITEVGTLTESVSAGDSEFVLNDTSKMPQLGTLVFDEGITQAASISSVLASIGASSITLADSSLFPTVYPYSVTIAAGTDNEETVTITNNTPNVLTFSETLEFAHNIGTDVATALGSEETLAYCYIDRRTNTVFLEGKFAFDHIARDTDSEESVITISPLNEVVFSDTTNFPIADFPHPVVLGRGTSSEEVVLVTANDLIKATLTLSGAPVNVHTVLEPGNVFDQLGQAYFFTSAFIILEDSTQFPDTGTVRLFPTDTFTVNAAPSGLGDRTIELASALPEWTDSSFVGYEIVFDAATTTVALRGQRRRIIDNTDDGVTRIVTVDKDFTDLGAAPTIGDTFVVFPILQYTSNDFDSNTLTLKKPIIENLTIPLNSNVELMVAGSTAAFSPVKFQGAGWDVIQSTPLLVELLIPIDIRDINDNRSASYLHDDLLGPVGSTITVALAPGDTDIFISPTAAFPDGAVLLLDSGGIEERLSYGKPVSDLQAATLAGDGTVTLNDSRLFPASGTIVLEEGTSREETIAYSANDDATGTLTLVGTLVFGHLIDRVVSCTSFLKAQTEVQNPYIIGTTADWYSPEHAGTTVPIGDPNFEQDTWQGPYVYAGEGEPSATGTVAIVNTSQLVPGPTLLSIDQTPSKRAVEVEDASAMLFGFPSPPYDVILGFGTGSRETVTVFSTALKNRAHSVLSANALVGDTTLTLTTLSPGTALQGAEFPDTIGYRVIIDEGGTPEVAYVLGTSGGTTLILEAPLVLAHSISDTVTLVADVLEVDNITKTHEGLSSLNNRSTTNVTGGVAPTTEDRLDLFPTPTPGVAELATPLVDTIPLASIGGLDIDGGRVILNFGNGWTLAESNATNAEVAGAVSITVDDPSVFPPTSATPYTITIGKGRGTEEKVVVTSVLGSILFLGGGTFGVLYAHDAGEVVTWEPGSPEDITYSEIDGTDLRFDRDIMLQYTHYPAETVIDSSANSNPSTDGFDFPLRMPVDIGARIQYLLDLIRAAGVQVELISER